MRGFLVANMVLLQALNKGIAALCSRNASLQVPEKITPHHINLGFVLYPIDRRHYYLIIQL